MLYNLLLYQSDRELDLLMRLNSDKLNGYLWNCNLVYEIGKIEPKKSYSVKLNIIPYQTGLIVSSLNLF